MHCNTYNGDIMTHARWRRKGFGRDFKNVTVYSHNDYANALDFILIFHACSGGGLGMMIRVFKQQRLLCMLDEDTEIFRAKIALGREPKGAKQREGDGKTPEGKYHICLVKENGRHGQSLGLDYPNEEDARAALVDGLIHRQAFEAILAARREGVRPPWGTPLGGEIYIHGGGAQSDWTQGCIALEREDMARLFAVCAYIDVVEIFGE